MINHQEIEELEDACRRNDVEVLYTFGAEQRNHKGKEHKFAFSEYNHLLNIACKFGSFQVAKFLIQDGCDPAWNNNEPFNSAYKNDHQVIMKFLLRNYPEVRSGLAKTFEEACKTGDSKIVKLVLDWENRVDIVPDLQKHFDSSVARGHYGIVELFLDIPEINPISAIRQACSISHTLDPIKTLLKHPRIYDNLYDYFKYFIKHSLNWGGNLRFLPGYDTLTEDQLKERKEYRFMFIKFLFSDQFLPYIPDNIHHAFLPSCEYGFFDILTFLCHEYSRYINPSILNNYALRNALKNGHLRVVHFLQTKTDSEDTFCDENIINDIFDTANADIIRHLLAFGVRVNLRKLRTIAKLKLTTEIKISLIAAGLAQNRNGEFDATSINKDRNFMHKIQLSYLRDSKRLYEVAIALQELFLPILLIMRIIDFSVPFAENMRNDIKYEIIYKIRHFHINIS